MVCDKKECNDVKINVVPSLTWNWLKTNYDVVSLPKSFDDIEGIFDDGEFLSLPKGMCIKKIGESDFPSELFGSLSGVFNKANPKTADSRCEKKSYFVSHEENLETKCWLEKNLSDEKVIEIEGNVSEPFVINLGGKKSDWVNGCSIFAKKGSVSTVIFVYSGNADFSFIRTKVFVEEDAMLSVVKVQLLENGGLSLDDTAIYQKDDSKVHFVQIELGGKHVDSGLHVVLQGNRAKFSSNVAYLCENEQHLDMNHIVDQYGKKSECKMFVQGTLKDKSQKTYRGTIDLKNGCCGSKGNEMEETLLLSPYAVNKSLPVILCDEEDVEGEHGATIGKLSKEMLFYMQTRGISEQEAEILLSKAKIQATADLIPCEEVKNLIYEAMN